MKLKRNNYLSLIAAIALCALSVLLILIIRMYLNLSDLQSTYKESQNIVEYPFHCAFITDSSSDDFWDSVYEAAREEGAALGIYVENFGSDLTGDYSTDKLIKMAIAAKTDAILTEPTGDFSCAYLMNTAIDAGIAVGTLYRDELRSERYNYTGVNSVSIGSEYGRLAIDYCEEDASSFLLLLNEEDTLQERRLLTSSIGQTLSGEREDARLDTLVINEENAFDAEENIRQFLKDYHHKADVIICTSLLQTQYVSQLVIDMNYVGDFIIIGSYTNASVLDALKNGVISASLVVNTRQLGQRAIQNLAEYLTTQHASDYTQVDTYIVTGEDAADLLQQSQISEGESFYEK